ncbi:hypothetical protein AVEN_101902-1, partial [Araneus ventricosus]
MKEKLKDVSKPEEKENLQIHPPDDTINDMDEDRADSDPAHIFSEYVWKRVGGPITAGESSKSSDLSYSKASSSEKEEELSSAFDSRDCKSFFFEWRENKH